MPDTWPDYPHHGQVLSYLERYAEHFGLGEHIWFGTEVVSAVPAGDGRWDVTTRSPPAAARPGSSGTPAWWSPTGTTGRPPSP